MAPVANGDGAGGPLWAPPYFRAHDADGLSSEALAIIVDHSLDKGAILEWADYYAMEDGVDFNRAPARDFEDAMLGMVVGSIAVSLAAFAPFKARFGAALRFRDYSTSDAYISSCLKAGVIVGRTGMPVYGEWRQGAERLEGFNVALYRAARDADTLRRDIGSLAEIDSYLQGRWRRLGDPQNRVPMTVGRRNPLPFKRTVARVAYKTEALRGWMQPVRYSPYPRNTNPLLEQFGTEKDALYAGEGEVHVHADCPIPGPEYIKITLLNKYARWRTDVHERYSQAGSLE